MRTMKTRARAAAALLVVLLTAATITTAAGSPPDPRTTAADVTIREGESIQAALDNASAGDVIRVTGVHREKIEIATAVHLTGNATLTAAEWGTMIKIVASNVTVSDLAIEGNGSADIGVEVIGRTAATANVTISNVTIAGCRQYGVWIRRFTRHPTVTNATIARCDTGVKLDINATRAAVTHNTIYNNTYGVEATMDVTDASIHHNVFNNTHNARDTTPLDSNNQWDNGSVGNYWSDYQGTDSDGDLIGDSPYQVPGGSHRDRYPLIRRPGNHTGGNGDNGNGDGNGGTPGFGIPVFLAALVLLAALRRHGDRKKER